MGYRTVVILSNNLAHVWEKDASLGEKIMIAASRPDAHFEYGDIIEQVHCDVQSLVAIDSMTGYKMSTTNWYIGQDHQKIKLQLLENAAEAMGYKLVKKD